MYLSQISVKTCMHKIYMYKFLPLMDLSMYLKYMYYITVIIFYKKYY